MSQCWETERTKFFLLGRFCTARLGGYSDRGFVVGVLTGCYTSNEEYKIDLRLSCSNERMETTHRQFGRSMYTLLIEGLEAKLTFLSSLGCVVRSTCDFPTSNKNIKAEKEEDPQSIVRMDLRTFKFKTFVER